jgi:hypothetical protein
VPRPGTPSRHTRSFARWQQKTGRGEGLIYNIPSAYFQTTRQNEEFLAQDGGARKGLIIEGQTSGNMRDDTSGRIEINESQ